MLLALLAMGPELCYVSEQLLWSCACVTQVLARHVDPQQMLEVVRLNEVLAEAQRGAAAADAAVQAVDKVRGVPCHARALLLCTSWQISLQPCF